MKKVVKNKLLGEVKVHDETFMIDLDADKYYALNPTATYVWNLLCFPISIDELKHKILHRYHVDEEFAKNALDKLLHEMIKRKMIVLCDED